MAAKQGITAHLSQASEDAKRAVLSRTTLTSSSWFSNLNTVCTIKSAPPKTPDVLQMLATKSGWLYKRNEQHVWQARWCCVVPHMFLYYFDATSAATTTNPVGNGLRDPSDHAAGSSMQIQQPTPAQQEEWNRAVQNGYGKNRRQPEKRSNFYLFSGNASHHHVDKETSTCADENAHHDESFSSPPDLLENGYQDSDHDHVHNQYYPSSNFLSPADASRYTSLQPAGIIDLECYTRVNRSSTNPLVLELAGDESINPDLRQFYFTAAHSEDADDWSDALLNQRHSALLDECDAYKQVCDGFAQQLQQLHSELDTTKRMQEDAQEELYRVRSQLELDRRNCWNMVEELVESVGIERLSTAPNSPDTVDLMTQELRSSLDQARRQDLGFATVFRLLRDYTTTMMKKAAELAERNHQLEKQLQESGQTDQEEVAILQEQVSVLERKHNAEKQTWQSQLDATAANYSQTQTQLEDVQRELASTRMEMTMYQTQQKNKMGMLQEHKRILKKEVIDLRSKLDNALSEVTALKLERTNREALTQQEREKNKLLERYVEKIESQVKVQQNMMEIISHSAACSVYGGDRSVDFGANGSSSLRGGDVPTDFKRNVIIVHSENHPAPSDSQEAHEEENDDDINDDDVEHIDEACAEKVPTAALSTPSARRLFTMEDDAKSHMSELTEDRTQRHYEIYRESFSPSPRHYRKQLETRSPPVRPPPYVIGGKIPLPSGRDNRRQSASSIPPAGPSRPIRLPRGGDQHQDNASTASDQRLSVAQKARLEADERATPVQVWIDESVEEKLQKKRLFGLGSGGSRHSNHLTSDRSTKSSSESQRSGLWRHVEEAILGPRSDIMSDSGSVSEDESSKESSDSLQGPDSTVKRIPSATPDKSRDTDSQSTMGLSILQRAQLQRAKQMEFLKQQGLINSENDVPAGAGAMK